VGLLLVVPGLLAAQSEGMRDSSRVLLLEHRFGSDSSNHVVVQLERGVVYRVEITGPGAPSLQPIKAGALAALLVPVGAATGDGPRQFQAYPYQAGPHAIRLSDVPSGSTAMLRLYRDAGFTRQSRERREHGLAFGVEVGAGIHSGYRLDPTGGANPRGGNDIEGCFLAQAGDLYGTCIGLGRQAFPDASYNVAWAFIEEQGRLVSVHLVGGRRTDLGATLRFSHALSAGPRSLSPSLLSIGLSVIQHLSTQGRRGVSVFCGWQHGRLGFAPETEKLDTDRFAAGVSWVN
jgi:hypothetical protein